MMSATSNDVTNSGDSIPEIAEKQQTQPVVSLLEKYSSLHRGIDEARKNYDKRRLEIESIEGDIVRLTDVDRQTTESAIKNAIEEKEALLNTLENLTLTNLLEAQESVSLAKSNHELVRLKEEEAMRVTRDDQEQFRNTCEVFREKIRVLTLRGELFGLKTPVALLSVYEGLQSPVTTCNKRAANEDGHGNDTIMGEANMQKEYLKFSDVSLFANILQNDCTNGILDDFGRKNIEQENDEEIKDLFEQLRTQQESNCKHKKILGEKKQNYQNLLEAKEKREKQKKDLQSQFERLQSDIHDVESQLENLNREMREAIELTSRFRNDVESRTSSTNCVGHYSKSTESATLSQLPPTRRENQLANVNDGTTTLRKSHTATYNPYARSNRRANCTTTTIPKASTASRTISPIAASKNETAQDPPTNRNSGCNINGNDSENVDDQDDHQPSQFAQDHQTSTIQKKTNCRQHPLRSRRVRTSRRFGESSFRVPDESMMKLTADYSSDDGICNTTMEKAAKSTHKKRGRKRRSILSDTEDTDDDDDDTSWLNISPFLSSSKCHHP